MCPASRPDYSSCSCGQPVTTTSPQTRAARAGEYASKPCPKAPCAQSKAYARILKPQAQALLICCCLGIYHEHSFRVMNAINVLASEREGTPKEAQSSNFRKLQTTPNSTIKGIQGRRRGQETDGIETSYIKK